MATPQLFVSYARDDLKKVTKLVHQLKSAGYAVWFDKESLLPGQNWSTEIVKAINASHFFLACLSQFSVAKTGFCQRELKIALDCLDNRPEGQIYLLPIRLDDCVLPSRFSMLERCDLFANEASAVDRILMAIDQGLAEQGIFGYRLRCLKGVEGQNEFRIYSPLAFIGRSEECHVCLKGSFISNHHASIESRGEKLLYRQISDKTATLVIGKHREIKLDGISIRQCDLYDKDRITIAGTIELEICIDFVNRHPALDPTPTDDSPKSRSWGAVKNR